VHGTDTSTGVGLSAQAVPDDLAWSVRHTLATAGVNPSDDLLEDIATDRDDARHRTHTPTWRRSGLYGLNDDSRCCRSGLSVGRKHSSSNFDEMRDQIIAVARLWSGGQGSKN